MTTSSFRASIQLILLGATVSACGLGTSSRLSGAKSSFESPLLVFMGGNTSCKRGADGVTGPRGLDFWPQLQTVIANVAAERDAPAWIATCHGSDAAVRFVASDAENAPPTTTDFAGIYAKIDALADGHEVLIAGHSYGGWLALKTAMALTSSIGALVTIDPISRETCSIWSPEGCVEFPSDVTNGDREDIASRTGTWVNYFQEETSWLHSGPAHQADENPERPVSHTAIDTDQAVWDRIGELALSPTP